MKKIFLLLALSLAIPVSAQQNGGFVTRPNGSGGGSSSTITQTATVPATCAVGTLYQLTVAPYTLYKNNGGTACAAISSLTGFEAPVADLAALQAITSITPVDKDLIYVDATRQLYTWSANAITGDYAPSDKITRTVTFTVLGSLVNSTAHGLTANQIISFSTTGTLPTGLSANTPYFIINPTANDFQISATSGGSAIAFSTAGTPTTTAITSGYWIQIASDLAIGATVANGQTARVGVINPVDSSIGASLISPPASPFIGARFGVKDIGGLAATNNIKINFSVQKYEGLTGSPTAEYWLNVNNSYVEFIYHSVSRGWVKKGRE
jgi:hypothetical protein